MYIIRLDDASEYMDLNNWIRMEELLDKYSIKPIFGIIPNNKDENLIPYGRVEDFWDIAQRWINKKWIPALHGYMHVFSSFQGGINPVNNRSEFAGLPLHKQKQMIRQGYNILLKHNIYPHIFFSPAHTFDKNTLKALKEETDIRIISDTVSNDIYFENDFYFVPQQSGKCRDLPFKVVTFCYHPNLMKDIDYEELERFIISNKEKFSYLNVDELLTMPPRKRNMYDNFLKILYFLRRKIS